MRKLILGLSSILVLGTTAGAVADAGDRTAHGAGWPPWPDHEERVVLRDVDGQRLGSVWLRQMGSTVQVRARLHSLTPPGFHGFHIHTKGMCDPDAEAGPFTTAEGHYVGDGERHGTHDGDMPSLYVAEDGTARLAFRTDRFTVDELQAGDGSAVMVHSGRDNFANIPDDRYASLLGESVPDEMTLDTGDAGSRFACGVLD